MVYNLFKGFVTHVIDPSNFWMRIGKDSVLKLFCQYQEKLDDFYNEYFWKFPCAIDELYPGYLVVVGSVLDNSLPDQYHHWKRAQVTRVDVDNNTADVFFVDFGYAALVKLDECKSITPELFNFIAPQARRVSLAGIKPLSKSWTSRASTLLEKQTNRDVVTLVIDYDDASCSNSVVIYSKKDDGLWQSLIHEMKQNELALGTDDNIQEYLTDEFVNECLERLENGHDAQDNDDATDDQNETTLLADADEDDTETEIWHDGVEENEIAVKCQDSLDTVNGVVGFDYDTLMQTRSISISKMRLDKGCETQEETKSKIAQDLQRTESEPSAYDDQDWDAVQDGDFHTDIVSQIYHSGLERQESNDGLRKLIEESKMLDLGPMKPVTEEYDKNCSNHNEKSTPSKKMPEEIVVSQGLSEIESYKLEKQIREMLMNQDEKESDFICASVYSVVEPDVDTPLDHLKVVIYAILEHVLTNFGHQSEVAFAILETYSDASAFGEAIIDVIQELKSRYVKKMYPGRSRSTNNQFAKTMALLFQHAEVWNSSVCKIVQDNIITLVERWILFNKARQISGDDIINSEFMYLESAETFLLQCHNLLKYKYECQLETIISEIRFKLLHEGTASWIRACLLDLLLSLSSGQHKPTCDVAVQTGLVEAATDGNSMLYEKQQIDSHIEFTSPEVKEEKQEITVMTETHSSDYRPEFSQVLADASSHGKRKEKRIPKSIRNLPPRLRKKYLPEHDMDVPLPSYPNPTADNTTINHSPSYTEPDSASPDLHGLLTMIKSTIFCDQSNAEKDLSSFSNDLRDTLMPYEPIGNIEESYGQNVERTEISSESAHQTFQGEESHQVDIGVSIDHSDYFSPKANLEQMGELYFADDQLDTESPTLPAFSCDIKTEIPTTTKDGHECHKMFEEEDIDFESVPDIGHQVIRYTPQQLRDLNPFAGQPTAEPWDLQGLKQILKKLNLWAEHPEEEHFSWREDFTKPRYKDGKTDSDLAFYQHYINYNKPTDQDVFGSSVDPTPIETTHNTEESLPSNCGLPQMGEKKSNLCDIASDLLNPTDVIPSNGDDTSQEGKELWHDDAPGPNGDFLRPKKNNDSSGLLSRKAKKKKGRGKPLDEFLQEQADLRLENEAEADEDLFSPEAIAMYEELEQQGVGNDFEDIQGARMLMPSKIGSHITSSSKRQSLFSTIRAEQSSEPPKPWCPGRKRFCTRCGSDNHVVYDCPDENSHLLLG